MSRLEVGDTEEGKVTVTDKDSDTLGLCLPDEVVVESVTPLWYSDTCGLCLPLVLWWSAPPATRGLCLPEWSAILGLWRPGSAATLGLNLPAESIVREGSAVLDKEEESTSLLSALLGQARRGVPGAEDLSSREVVDE